jgi:hypothetical protein
MENIVDGRLQNRKNVNIIEYCINEKVIVNTEKEMFNEVIKLVHNGYKLDSIIVTKDGLPYYDDFGRDIKKILQNEYF